MECLRDRVFFELTRYHNVSNYVVLMEGGVKVEKKEKHNIIFLDSNEKVYANINFYRINGMLQLSCPLVGAKSLELDAFLEVCEIIREIIKE